MDELLARMRAASRRSTATTDAPRVQLGDLVVDLAARRVTRSNRAAGSSGAADGDVRLTPTEWHLLEVLLRNPGKLLSRQQLLEMVWGPGYGGATGNLRLYMAQLRHKLEPDPSRPRWLLTEPGMGYRYQPDSERDDMPSSR
jgi:two-component system, OmpR family, KDP operon response regulator KdpE